MKTQEYGTDITIRNRMLPKLNFICGDEGLNNIIHKHLVDLENFRLNEPKHRNISLIFNSTHVNTTGGVQGQLQKNYMSEFHGEPTIEMPNGYCNIYIDDDTDENGLPQSIDIEMNLKNGIIFLHELNHMVHHHIDDGLYKNPFSGPLFNYDTEYRKQYHKNSSYGTFMGQTVKADELETYWRCILDSQAATPKFNDETVDMVKSLNNINMRNYEKETLFMKNWLGKSEQEIDDAEMTEAKDWFSINKLHPINDYEPSPEERPEGKFASREEILKYVLEHPEWEMGQKMIGRR